MSSAASKPRTTIAIPLTNGATVEVNPKHVASMWWATHEGVPYTLITVTQNGERKIYATALTWADAVRIWEEAKGRWPR